jgi:hypothetical protein
VNDRNRAEPSSALRGVARSGVVLSAACALVAACVHDTAPRETFVVSAPAARPRAIFPPDERGAQVVVLVAIDGVRWQEVFAGVERERALASHMAEEEIVGAAALMPNLWWLLRTRGAALGGTCHAAMRASGPAYISLPGYIEMLTGMRSSGCTTNDCALPAADTLADAFAEGSADAGEVAFFASWPQLSSGAARRPDALVISTGRGGTNHVDQLRRDEAASALFDAGEAATPAPGYGNYRPDRYTAALASHYLRAREPRFMFLSLGDTDELAHKGDYRGYLEALRSADGVVGDIAVALAEMSARGTPTLLLVTTDHGRADSFADHERQAEAGDVWMVAAGDAVKARGCLETSAPSHLADIATTVRAVAGLPAVRIPPPALSGEVLAELFAPPPPEPSPPAVMLGWSGAP